MMCSCAWTDVWSLEIGLILTGDCINNVLYRLPGAPHETDRKWRRAGTVHSDTSALRVSHKTLCTAVDARPRGESRTEVIGWPGFGQHAKPSAGRNRASGAGALGMRSHPGDMQPLGGRYPGGAAPSAVLSRMVSCGRSCPQGGTWAASPGKSWMRWPGN